MMLVEVLLSDGTTREFTFDEFRSLTVGGTMTEALNGKYIIDVHFYEDDGT